MGWSVQPRSPSLDIVVPTYRCDLDILRGICSLEVVNKATTIIMVVDRPECAQEVQQALETHLIYKCKAVITAYSQWNLPTLSLVLTAYGYHRLYHSIIMTGEPWGL